MANTLIQLKHSLVTDIPPSLNLAEPAYSYTSNTLFIGTPDGLGSLNVGGVFYTSQIDDATSEDTPNTLVKRDASGNASFNYIIANNITATIDGNAATASKWLNPIDLGLDGDATGNVSIDGSSNVTLTVDLTASGVTSGTYGGTTQIPVITIDTDGRISSAANANVATTLSFGADGPSTGTLDLLTDSLVIEGGDGIGTVAFDSNNTIRVDVDNTVIRSSGDQTIDGDIIITGNLSITGNTVTYDVQTYSVNDPIVLYANNNPGNVVDIGFVAHYEDGSANTKHTGLIRHVSSNTWYLFEGYEPHVQENNILDINDPTLEVSTLVANLKGGTVSNLTSVIAVADGGLGANTFTTNEQIIYNGTNFESLANVTTTGSATLATSNTITSVTTDGYGRLTAFVATPIVLDTSQITTGILGVERGGTGANTFTTNGVLLGQGTSAVTTVSSSTEGHILTINSSGVPVFEMLSGGTF
jgi:hypothetical protein